MDPMNQKRQMQLQLPDPVPPNIPQIPPELPEPGGDELPPVEDLPQPA